MRYLPHIIQLPDNVCLVHGGVEPALLFSKQKAEKLICTRYVNSEGEGVPLGPNWTQPEKTVHWSEMWKGPEKIVYGHHIFAGNESKITDFSVGLDTGCVFGGRLSAIIIKGDTFEYETVSVASKRNYVGSLLADDEVPDPDVDDEEDEAAFFASQK
jgi:hypothetical protein